MNKPLGIILYKGLSALTNKRRDKIVVIATGFNEKTANEKTGEMLQIWILRPDIPPILATRLGCDNAVCGNCKHRDFGSCYVNLAHGPERVYDAYHNDRYVKLNDNNLEEFRNKNIRLGAYGDPAVVPINIITTICDIAETYTGYTHQWDNDKVSPLLKNYCMASCDTALEQQKAEQKGWRTFRVRLENEALLENEFKCPASKEAGNLTNCLNCSACMGLNAKIKKNPCIIIHGADFRIKKFQKGIKKLKNKKKYRIDFSQRYKEFVEICNK